MPESASTNLKLMPPVRTSPPQGGIRFVTKNFFLKVLGLVLRGAGFKLQIDGGTFSEAGRVVVKPGGPNEEPDEGGGEYTGWEPSEGDCGCDSLCELQVKVTSICGRSQCCGVPYNDPEDPDITRNYSTLVTTESCTLYDYTGPVLSTSSCIRVTVSDANPTGDGTAVGNCEFSPDCGDGTNDVDNGCDAPLCFGLPGPGFKCYAVNSTERVYGKFCVYDLLGSKAAGAAEEVVDPEFVQLIPANIENLSSGYGGGQFTTYTFEFRRYGRRKPAHLVLTIRELDAGMPYDTEYEEVISIPAGDDNATYEMPIPPDGRFAIIHQAQIFYGRLPD